MGVIVAGLGAARQDERTLIVDRVPDMVLKDGTGSAYAVATDVCAWSGILGQPLPDGVRKVLCTDARVAEGPSHWARLADYGPGGAHHHHPPRFP